MTSNLQREQNIAKIAGLLQGIDASVVDAVLTLVTAAAGHKTNVIASVPVKKTGRLTIQEAAAACGLAPGTLYNVISARRGPAAIKSGRKVLIDAADLERWMKVREAVIRPNRH